MSGEDENHSGPDAPEHDHSIITTRLRACEACKTRKVRCDKLDPCSACKSSNIPCWTAPRTSQQKRQRAVASARLDDQLSKINEQLSQLQTSVDILTKQKSELSSRHRSEIPSPISNRDFGPRKANLPSVATPNSVSGKASLPSDEPPYLGESSFEVHSHQTGQILDIALHNSPAARQGQDVTSSLQSLRALHSANIPNSDVSFTSDLPMPPVQVALAALRLIDVLPHGFLLCSPFGDGKGFRQTCQKYYFPIDGYSASDFIITNGGLMGIIGLATASQLESHGIDPAGAAEVVEMCSNNVSVTIEKLSIFLEPRMANIECLLYGVQTAMADSDHNKAWYLISFAARLCMDSGLNRLRDNAEDIGELNRKKICFWFTYCFDKALSLNFGRSPNFSDYDISVGYPQLAADISCDAIFVWFDIAKLQGSIYEKLYSAKAQQDGPEMKATNARHIASEFNRTRERLQGIFSRMSEAEREPFLDTEITLLANLALVYRALPSQKPAHPLRFSDECIAVARETLELHETLCTRLFSRSQHQIRMYIDWNLSICPFTPFIVILGTAILDTNAADMHLLEKVVESLERASVLAPGAKKLLSICKILLRGGKSCVEQTLSSGPPPVPQTYQQRPPTASYMGNGMQSDVMMPGVMDTDWSTMMPEDWTSLQLDNPDNMSMLFDNYLAGNSGMMPIFETDTTRFDTM
ncbi:hypothetical protein ONS95_010914 [Cadophora gregata]|uniref:uncharacterized protein n=1 Tax=Cadophora gregata TaxID=51156 RepID=UPI0026DB1DFC|nr:uncharacterized protein ONS95_010914 [Cadophora gregata]KAK0119466.1 hypothetical protein ONS95_010914 [Cadophora gregata]